MNLYTRSVLFLGVWRHLFSCSRLSVLIWSMMLLSACSLLSPVKVDAPCKYRLTCVPSYIPTKARRPITILVTTPDTNPVYDTTKMTYTIRPYQIAYFRLNEWAETPSQMLRPLIVQTLEESRHFKAVVTPPFGGQADYVLNTEILEFNQDFTCRIPHFILVVRAQIVKTVCNKIIATKVFSIRLPFPCRPPYGGVFAANHATSIFLSEMALFCLETI